MFAMHGNHMVQLVNVPAISQQKRRYAARLKQKKFRDQEKCFLAEGLRTISELLKALPQKDMLELVVVSEGFKYWDNLDNAVFDRLYSAPEKDFKSISDTEHSQGICAVFKQPQLDLAHHLELLAWVKQSLIVVCDGIQDPGNLGTIMRTSAWFGADLFVCGNSTVDAFNPKTVRASAGCFYALPLIQQTDLIELLPDLKSSGYHILASGLHGVDANCLKRSQKSVIVLGNEGKGVSRDIINLADQVVTIKGKPEAVESLNASVSAGILISLFSNAS